MDVGVVVPWRDSGCPHRARAWEWVQARIAAVLPDVELTVGHSPPGPFNICAALNDGLTRSSADIIVMLGADVIADRRAIDLTVEAITAEPDRWVMMADHLQYLDEPTTTDLLAQPPAGSLVMPSSSALVCQLGWGPIAATRDLFLAIDGHDERLTGWGCEDDVFGIVASARAGPPIHIGAVCAMLWHPKEVVDLPYLDNYHLMKRYQAAAGNLAAIDLITAERATSATVT